MATMNIFSLKNCNQCQNSFINMKNVDFLISWKAINPFLPDIDYSEI